MKALISGAGIAGLAAARFLEDRGWESVLIEKAAGPRNAGYAMDFFGSGYDAMARAGLIEALKMRRLKVRWMEYVNERGRTRSMIDYDAFVASVDGRLLSVLRGDLEATLREALPQRTELRYGASIATAEQDDGGVSVTLEDGSELSGDLLIGADGIHSHTRALLFGPEEQFLRYLGYHAAAFLFEDAEMVAALGGSFKMLTVPNRQMGLIPTGADTLAAFVAFAADQPERPEDPAAAIRAEFEGLGWLAPDVLDRLDRADDVYYDWMAQIEMDSWHRGRTVLLGDAAYAVSLLAGQGASMAVGGAYVLADTIAEAPVPEALSRYEAQVRPLILEKQAAGRKTADWFVPPSEFHNVVRDLFLNAARMPGLSVLLKSFFAPSLKSVISGRR